jgi:pyruvyltransferase
MNVHWHQCGRKRGNLGDKLTPLLLDYFGVSFEWVPPDKAKLFGIGSVLHLVPPRYRGIVWSTGALFGSDSHDLSGAQVLALRGRLTLSLVKCRERDAVCLGDGGLLASLFFRPCRKHYKLGVIPHYAHADEPVFTDLARHSEIRRIDICDEPRSVIQQIGQCEHILSSSLHGLIIADSLGIPNRWIDAASNSSKILGSGFKFRDYYSVFGFDNLEPEVLRPGDELDRLLTLFEDYRRPCIEDLKASLLESFRGVVESRSHYSWNMAKMDMVKREQAILQQLSQNNVRPTVFAATRETHDADYGSAGRVQPFSEIRNRLRSDPSLLGRFVVEFLSLIRELHEAGVTHGDIRDTNVVLQDGRPLLTNFGWCAPIANTETLSRAHYVAADLRAVGQLMRDVSENHPQFATIGSLLMQSQPNDSTMDGAAACTLAQLLSSAQVDSYDQEYSGSESQQLELSELSRAIAILLEAIAEWDRRISSLRADLETSCEYQWKLEPRLAALQLAQLVPKHATCILIDGDEWRNEFAGGPKSVPFLEQDGAYWGPPADDDAAIGELTRLQGRGAGYVVIVKPAFWWLEYYSGFRDYLNSSATCCHKDDLLIVYRLGIDASSEQELV